MLLRVHLTKRERQLCTEGVGLVENMSGEPFFPSADSSESEETVRWKAALRQEVEEVRHYMMAWPHSDNVMGELYRI